MQSDTAGSPVGRPRGVPTPNESSRPELDAQLVRLRDSAQTFARLPPAEKARLLEVVRARFFEVSRRMVELSAQAKGIAPGSPLVGEEWLSGPAISLRALRLFAASLEDVARHGAPRIESRDVRRLPQGGTGVTVVPRTAYDRTLFPGWHAEAWLEATVDPARMRERQASFYRKATPEGRVVLVLGAGNVGSISVLDVLYHSFVEGAVCLLKMSPVNAYLGPSYEQAFEPLIARGFLALAHGGADVGAYLASHAAFDGIHITGSEETHDRVVWGAPGPERDQRKREGRPLTTKRVTSELGNVSPVLLVPEEYSDRELDYAARSVAGMVVNNASFNCNAAKMIVTARAWKQRDEFLARLGRVFGETPARVAYYPGAHERYGELTAAGAGARIERYGEHTSEKLPWTLVSGLDPNSGSALFRVEPFCSIVCEVPIEAADAREFLGAAVRFANEKLWGTLNAMLMVPGSAEKDRVVAAAIEQAIRDLRYGTVGVNLWPAVGYGLGTPPWGGHPSSTLADVQSGLGWGHDTLMLEATEKVVVRGSLVALPEPFWHPGHRRLAELGAELAAIEAKPKLGSMLGAAWAALRR